MPHDRLILASASPRRRELLASLGRPFDVIPPDLAEPILRPAEVAPRAWAVALAYFKARNVWDTARDRVVLGADTIVVAAGQLLGKPRDVLEARRMLELQAGTVSEVVTGVALLWGGADDHPPGRTMGICITRVWMRRDPGAVDAYLQSGEWQGKAGAYGIQDVGERLVERIEGSYSNVVGLPLERVRALVECAESHQTR